MQSLLRLLGRRIWFVVSGLLILLGAYLSFRFGIFEMMALFCLAGLLWSLARKSAPLSRPLSARACGMVAGAYLALIGIHVGTIWIYDDEFLFYLLTRLSL
jgi:hypothetical protein